MREYTECLLYLFKCIFIKNVIFISLSSINRSSALLCELYPTIRWPGFQWRKAFWKYYNSRGETCDIAGYSCRRCIAGGTQSACEVVNLFYIWRAYVPAGQKRRGRVPRAARPICRRTDTLFGRTIQAMYMYLLQAMDIKLDRQSSWEHCCWASRFLVPR